MKRIANSLLDLIGNTPLLAPQNFMAVHQSPAKLLFKLEYFNPGGSVKDRVGANLLLDAEKRGLVGPATVIIEPTSGNTGVGLAIACAAKHYRLILTMPETMSLERRRLLAALGAEIVLTPGAEGMAGSVKKAEELAASFPSAYIPQQFENPANPASHQSTAAEIWADCAGDIDIFVATVGTGGTLTGVGEALRAKKADLQIVAVEPAASPLLSQGWAGPHKIQGIGANFVPQILNQTLYNEVLAIEADAAYQACRELAKEEGLLVGISSGAAAAAALQLAQRPENAGKTILAILPDTGERYLSTDLFEA